MATKRWKRMIGPEAIPPAVPVALVAAGVLLVPRRIGYGAAIAVLLGVTAWVALVPAVTGPAVPFLGLEVVIVDVNTVSRLVGLVFGGFGAGAVGFGYATGADRRHLSVALWYVAAAMFAVFAGGWLGLVIGWELMAIMSTLLVWLYGGDAVRAGYRYALWHALGGGLFVAGVVAHLHVSGLDSAALQFDQSGLATTGATLLVGGAVAINAGVIGLHTWLPDTYPRPHVMASVFLCAYTTKTAVYAAYRTFPEGNLVLAYIGGVMTIYGAAYALAQTDMRRLLSYHIQAQVGYMLAGIGIGSALGVAGGFAHLFNNVLYKGLLFMVAGAIILRTGHNRLDKFGALGRTSPAILLAFLVAALSITAAPGFNGFVSKGMVVDASVDAGEPMLRWLLLAGAVGTVMSFAKFGYYAFLEGDASAIGPATWAERVVFGAIAVACIALGVWYQTLFAVLPAPNAWETTPYSVGHLQEAVAILLVGLVGFLSARSLLQRLHGGIDVDRLIDPVVFFGTRLASRTVARAAGSLDRSAVRVAWWILHTVRKQDSRDIGNEIADQYIRSAIGAVRAPRDAVRRWLPDRWLGPYEDVRSSTPSSETGINLSIEASLVVLTVVLALVIALALYF